MYHLYQHFSHQYISTSVYISTSAYQHHLFCYYFNISSPVLELFSGAARWRRLFSKQANKQTSKQANKQTSKNENRQTSGHWIVETKQFFLRPFWKTDNWDAKLLGSCDFSAYTKNCQSRVRHLEIGMYDSRISCSIKFRRLFKKHWFPSRVRSGDQATNGCILFGGHVFYHISLSLTRNSDCQKRHEAGGDNGCNLSFQY